MALPSMMLILLLEFGFRVWDIQKNGLPDSLFFVRCKEKRGKKLVLEGGILFKQERKGVGEGFFPLFKEPLQCP